MVAHYHNPSYTGSIYIEELQFEADPSKKYETLSEK
jgi:hypothetical protein